MDRTLHPGRYGRAASLRRAMKSISAATHDAGIHISI